jgi:phospholipid/cholesterol/gamma-HCH transport system ATP-binding protein
MLDKQQKGIIAVGDPRVLVNEAKDARVREFLGRGEDAKVTARQKQPSP